MSFVFSVPVPTYLCGLRVSFFPSLFQFEESILPFRSDVLPVSSGTAVASLALIQKQLKALGLPDWSELSEMGRS